MAKDITVALELDNKQFNKALKQSQKDVKKFSKESSSDLDGLKGAFAGLVTAATLKSIVDVGSSFQDLQNSLNIVFGSVEEGAAQFARIKTFAAETQFSVATLTQAFVQLKGAGVEPTNELLKTFADTSSVVVDQMGAFQAMLDLVSRSTAGGLGLEDLNRLADRGIPVFTILNEKLGITRLEVSEFGKTAAGAEQIIDSLTEGLNERFGGALEKSAGNISRATNNLGDAFDNLQNALFGAFSDDATGAILKLTAAIDKLAENTSAIKDIVEAIKGFAVAFIAFKAIGFLSKGINGMATALIGGSRQADLLSRNFKQLNGGVGRLKQFFTGNWIKGRITGPLGAAAGATAKLRQVLLTLFGVISAGLKILLRFAGIAGIIYGVATAFNALAKIFFDVDPFGWLQEKIQGAYDWLVKLAEKMGLISQEPIEVIDPDQVAIIDDINEQLQLQLEARKLIQAQLQKERDELDRLEKKFTDFYSTLIDNAEDAALEQQHINRALKKLEEDLKSGAITLAVYNQAMKALEPSTKAITDAIGRANDALIDFNSEVAQTTDDLQKELDQIGMTELQRQLDDINREMNLLADETIAKLQAELIAVGGTGTQAGKDIQAQIDKVTQATKDAIQAQQELATEAYEASRTFEHGWNEALQQFIEDSTNEADKAKRIFEGKLSFKDLLDSMVEMLIRSQVQKLMGSLLGAMGGSGGGGGGIGGFFKSIFGLAKGGPAQGGRPYIVGEEGPELFVPKTSGTVVPNGAMGGQTVNNNTYITNSISAVDAKSVAQLFAENRKTLLGTVQMAQNEMPYG
jgi:phage tail tape-measure protein